MSPRRTGPPARSSLVLTRLSEVAPQRVSWLWRHRIPLGMVTLLAGDGGRGKSTLMLDIVARLTTGRPMPGEEKGFRPETVLIFSAEDHLQSVIVPRLDLAGANRRCVLTQKAKTTQGDLREVLIEPGDLDLLEEFVRDQSVALVLFDPMVAYVGADTNLHHNQDARRVLGRLHGLAERSGCAVVGIHHFNRALHQDAVHRLTGSAGMGNASRSVLVVAPDPENEGRMVLALAKHNLAPQGTPSLAYKLVSTENSDHPRIEWCGEVALGANDLVAVSSDPEERGKLAEAREYLRKALASDWEPEKEIERDAPCSERTLREAKRREGVVSRRAGGRWLWGLPAREHDPPSITSLQPCSLDVTGRDPRTLGEGCNPAKGGERPKALEKPEDTKPDKTVLGDTCSRCGATLSDTDSGFLCPGCVRAAS
jgi:hypothetical protein